MVRERLAKSGMSLVQVGRGRKAKSIRVSAGRDTVELYRDERGLLGPGGRERSK